MRNTGNGYEYCPCVGFDSGSENIVVTVLDDGIEAHEDMEDKWGIAGFYPDIHPVIPLSLMVPTRPPLVMCMDRQ
ncbi:MAG: hypothetical protein R3B93_19615 [Bacteroidia bacterium]